LKADIHSYAVSCAEMSDPAAARAALLVGRVCTANHGFFAGAEDKAYNLWAKREPTDDRMLRWTEAG
jgi:hypothetical protein